MIQAKDIELVEISKVIPNKKNRNKHPDDQITRLADIIKYQGFRNPLIVSNRTGQLVAGHGRLLAAKFLKMTHVPVIYQDFDSEEQEYAAQVSDNAIASWAELDLSGINVDLPELGPDFNIDMLGIKDFELEPADKYADKDADATPQTRPTTISIGDLFSLGTHRLLCGDSTDGVQVTRLMNGEKADMVFTDPPYGVSYEQGKFTGNKPKQKFEAIANDELRGDDLKDFLCSVWNSIQCNEGCTIYSWSPPLLPGAAILSSLVDSGWHIQSQIIWDKKRLILGRSDYQWRHEICWYGYKGKGHYWCGDRDQTTVWEQKRDTEYEHPTQKPVELGERAIRNSSRTGGLVYDAFSGSGSTLIACEKTNRKCYGMEIDPQYVDVVINRWQKFTGDKAFKINHDGSKTPYDEIRQEAGRE